MNNETINSRSKKKHNTSNNKLKIVGASAVLAGALFAAPSLVSADSWQANTPSQIADSITNTSTPYTIKSGDSLWGISEALKTKGLSVTPDALAFKNHIADPNWIYTGNSLTFTGQAKDSSQPTNSDPAPSSSQQIDKSTLETKLQEANKYIYTQGVYTENSLDSLRQAAMRGNGVIKSDAATQQDVTNAVNNIDQAIGGLVKVSSQQVNKQPVQAKLQEANKYIYTQGVYTENSLDSLRQAAMRGNGVIKSDAATQQDMTNAVNNIDQAIGGLVKVSSQQVNKQPLQAKLQEANKYIYTQGVYTENSLDSLRQTAMKGNGVIKSDAATQQDVTNAVNNIDQAISGLVKQ